MNARERVDSFFDAVFGESVQSGEVSRGTLELLLQEHEEEFCKLALCDCGTGTVPHKTGKHSSCEYYKHTVKVAGIKFNI